MIKLSNKVSTLTLSLTLGLQDVVYSDVKLQTSEDVTPSSNDKHTEVTHADDVTYSEVVVLRQQPK